MLLNEKYKVPMNLIAAKVIYPFTKTRALTVCK
jgi:hypothetical protein